MNDANRRLELLEEQRLRGLPDLKQQLVETYKRGRSGYLRLLLSAGDLRGFARATRAMTALTFRQERVLGDYRQTVDALHAERMVLQTKMAELKTREVAARRARAAGRKSGGRSRGAHRRRSTRAATSRRSTSANCRWRASGSTSRSPGWPRKAAVAVAVPLAPFRGGLEWPVTGELACRFGQPTGRQGGAAGPQRHGDRRRRRARACAPSTAARWATPRATPGWARWSSSTTAANNYSLYGYLLSLSVQRGEVVRGRSGSGPGRPVPGRGRLQLYFELRIDGRSVDPVQWLKPR